MTPHHVRVFCGERDLIDASQASSGALQERSGIQLQCTHMPHKLLTVTLHPQRNGEAGESRPLLLRAAHRMAACSLSAADLPRAPDPHQAGHCRAPAVTYLWVQAGSPRRAATAAAAAARTVARFSALQPATLAECVWY